MKEGVERLFPVQKEAFCTRYRCLFPAKRALFCTPASQKISGRVLIPLAVSFANTITKIVLTNSKTKLILSQRSQYSERENRIRQHYLSGVVPKRKRE
jgi:hypothetical protein